MLQLAELEILRVKRDLRNPWRTANGTEDHVESIFLKSTSSEGLSLWVESCPLATPFYLPETAETAFCVIVNHLAPMVLGKAFGTPQSAFDQMAAVKGNSFAKAALDISFWAHWCHYLGQSLSVTLGAGGSSILAGRTVSLNDASVAELAAHTGCPRLKVKIASAQDLDALETMRKRCPAIPIHVDCNGAFSISDHVFFERLDRIGVAVIEQPLHYRDLPAHAELQKALETPIALDESIREFTDADVAIRLGACRAMCLKPGRVGGITEFMRILALCVENGVGCYVGGMLESGLGTAMNMELAALDGMTYVSDLPLSEQYFDDDLITKPIVYSTPGHLVVGTKPWVAYEPDEDAIRKHAVQSIVLSA
jgi:O-succinylbenzoate synthase